MKLLKSAINALEHCNAKDIKIYDLRGYNPFFDYSIVATAVAERQLNALISQIYDEAEKEGFEVRNCVGRGSKWILVDLNDIMINFFTYEERLHFDLDKMWSNRPLVTLPKEDNLTNN